MSPAKPGTIDELLADVNAEQRAVLEKLRRAGYVRLGDLTHANAAKLRELHGLGRKAIAILQTTLEEHGQSLKIKP